MTATDRKAFALNWIITGLIIGLIVIAVFASILSKVFVEQARQSADREFNEVYSRVNALCSANAGEEMLYNINIPDIVELMYVSNDKKVLPNDIEDKKEGYGTANASNLCIKFREEPLKCKRLKCKTEMSYIGQKKTVMSLADRILSKPEYVEYPVYFMKGDCGVTVLKEGKCDSEICDENEMCGYTCAQTAEQSCDTGFFVQ